MFYIIRVAHRAQSKQKGTANSAAQKELWDCISETIPRARPALIAEELNEDALVMLSKDRGGPEESIAKEVADQCRVGHRFCDPSQQERARIGYVEGSSLALQIAMNNEEGLSNEQINSRGFAIEVARYWPLREQYWLDQLCDVVEKDVVFVCGDAHVESFRELLAKNSIDSTVTARRIGVIESDDVWWQDVNAYLESHPELRE